MHQVLVVDFECKKLTGKKLMKYICSRTDLEPDEIETIEKYECAHGIMYTVTIRGVNHG